MTEPSDPEPSSPRCNGPRTGSVVVPELSKLRKESPEFRTSPDYDGKLERRHTKSGHICYALKDVWYAPQTHTDVAVPISGSRGNGWLLRTEPHVWS